MGKAKRAEKRDRKTEREEDREVRRAEEERAAKRLTLRRISIGVMPVAIGVIATGLYYWTNDSRPAGMALLVGALVWLPLALSLIGSQVVARDRKRASALDYGR